MRSHYDTSGFARGVARLNSKLFVADEGGGTLVLSNLNALVVETNFIPTGGAYDVETYGSYALVAAGYSGFEEIFFDNKITNQWMRLPVDYTTNAGGTIMAFRIEGADGHAWIADRYRGVVAIKVGSSPSYAGRYGSQGLSIDPFSGYAWLGGDTNALSAWMADPASPKAVSKFANNRMITGIRMRSETNGLLLCNDSWHPEQWQLLGFDAEAIDLDGDGLPDAWERDHFGNLDQDQSTDYDNDGVSDWGEYLLNSDPKSPDSDSDMQSDYEELLAGSQPCLADSRFEMSEHKYIRSGSFANFVVQWSSFSGHQYAVYRSMDLSITNGWVEVATNLPATPPENIYTDQVPTAVSEYFYKIESR